MSGPLRGDFFDSHCIVKNFPQILECPEGEGRKRKQWKRWRGENTGTDERKREGE